MKVTKDDSLEVKLEGGNVVISIGAETLCYALWMGDDVFESGDRIADVDVFAKEFVRALHQETEDGSTPVHRFFDEVAREGLGMGEFYESVRSEGEDEPEDTPRALHLLNPGVLDGRDDQ